jgi:hypothetical protein
MTGSTVDHSVVAAKRNFTEVMALLEFANSLDRMSSNFG